MLTRLSCAPFRRWECSKEGGQLLLDYGIEYDHSMSHHDCLPYYLRTGDSWTKVEYQLRLLSWLTMLTKIRSTTRRRPTSG